MRDEQNRGVVVTASTVDQFGHPVLVGQVETEQRLVAQQHLGVTDEGLRDAQPLLFAARHRADGGVGVRLRTHLRDGGVDDRAPSGAAEQAGAPAVSVDAETDQVASAQRQTLVEGLLLRHVSDVGVARPRRGSGDADGSARRGQLSEQDLEQRRLSGAVGTQHGDELALLHGEVQVGPQRALTERQAGVAQFDGGGTAHDAPFRASASDCAVAVCHCTKSMPSGSVSVTSTTGMPAFSAFSRMFSVTLSTVCEL